MHTGTDSPAPGRHLMGARTYQLSGNVQWTMQAHYGSRAWHVLSKLLSSEQQGQATFNYSG